MTDGWDFLRSYLRFRAMKKIKVSIIIPVYGVERYIERCAHSLFGQTMDENIEFIFVNDCTKDRSIEILKNVIEEYPNRKDQVTIITHDKNMGLSTSRVTGIKASKGEYVVHCDSDDWVEPDMYQCMYEEAKNTDADIVGCDYWIETKTKSWVKKQDFRLPKEDMVYEMIYGDKIESYFWCRMFRRSIYNSDLYFADSEIGFLEDMAVVVPLHLAAKKIAYVGKPLYHYNKSNPKSITGSLCSHDIDSAFKVLDKLTSLNSENKKILSALRWKAWDISTLLITEEKVYDPIRWQNLNLYSPEFALSKRGKIGVLLVRLRLFKTNLLFQKIYKCLYCYKQSISFKLHPKISVYDT